MRREFRQIEWSTELEEDWRNLLALAVREDLERVYDWTTVALVPEHAQARAAIVARSRGVVAGLPAARIAAAEFDRAIVFTPLVEDGARVEAGERLANLAGPARSLLTAERTMLNVLTHLSGIATLTRQFVDAAGPRLRVYDTRKTTPGWRRLEKYAVRMGGGHNHRLGLFDAVLIKDNHLQQCGAATGEAIGPAEAVRRARAFVAGMMAGAKKGERAEPIIEVEVDTLEQLREVLAAEPDIVLLDNMSPEVLREAAAIRERLAPGVELEASGGVNLATIGAIGATGVERASVGALTHSAPALDIALDWI